MNVRLFLPLLIAIGALIFFPNGQAIPKRFETLSMPELLNVLKWGGMSPSTYLGEDGDLRVNVDLDGHPGVLIARGCGSPQCAGINAIHARSRIELAARDEQRRHKLLTHINQFNASYPLARTYLDTAETHDNEVARAAMIALELPTRNGISSARLGIFLASFAELRTAFGRHMAAFIDTPASPAKPMAPASVANTSAPARPAQPPMPPEPLTIRVSRLQAIGDGCRIHGQIEGASADTADLRVIVPSRNKRFDYLVVDADQALPELDMGSEVPCRDLERIVLERIAVCGSAAPFGDECPAAGLILGDDDLSPVTLVRVR